MPKTRPPRAIWNDLRWICWKRDRHRCVRCQIRVSFVGFHLDHIISGKYGTNKLRNLRVLCPQCHVLRACHRHRGMIAKALSSGLIPVDWRELVWEDDPETIQKALGKKGSETV